MARRTPFVYLALLLVLTAASALFGQGVQTATLEGKVTDQAGGPLPGVTVTAKSPALMGERQAATTPTGDYVLRGLPPGEYTISMSLEGMQNVNRKMTLSLGLPTRLDATMRLSAVSEAITVTASSPAVLESSTVGANIRAETVQQLPLLRTPVDIAQLSPGVTGDRGGRATTPVGGQISINGGMAYDNNILINGMNFQDNIFGNTNNLFVEDAIQETQVLTSGISAEYGHFTGGVVNVITKSGGNQFQGSFRDNMTDPSWLALTPWEEGFRGIGVNNAARAPHVEKLSHTYEATLGGPIWRDRVWFFGAGRKEKASTAQSLAMTGIPWTLQTENERPEFKLTASLGSAHTLQADYIDNPVKRNLESQVTPMVPQALGTNSVRENRGYSAFYSGVLATNVFAEARYSQKHFGFRNLGGHSRDIHDSPMRSATRFPGVTTAGTFNAPYFDATDPEDRDNEQYFAAGSYFLTSQALGTHDLKGGYERFVDTRIGGNSQTSTDYVFLIGYKVVGGQPVFDSDGQLIPVFSPQADGASTATRLQLWIATRGAQLDSATDSLFVNDRWNLNEHWSFNLGFRYEKTKSEATGDIVPIDTSNFVPRLAASYDPLGTGRYKFDVTYGKYVGRYNPALAGANTAVGRPSQLLGHYIGPKGEGRDFAPGFDVKNYNFYSASVPTANIFTDQDMHAPVANEWTVSAGAALPKNGWVKATFNDRKFTDFIETFITIDQGCTNVSLQGINVGCIDNVFYRNSNGPKREYRALELQAHYDLTRRWGIEGNWTHQFRNHGNYEGESGQSITTSEFGDRPEMQSPRELPFGRLEQFEADRIRLWTVYNFGLGAFGNLSTGVLYRYDSPQVFNYSTSVNRSSQSTARNPGYKNPGSTVTLFWGDRGEGEFNASSLFDVSLQWNVSIARVTPWVKFDVRNVLDADTQIAWNTTITPNTSGPRDEMGYPTEYTKAATFGRPRGINDFVRPREYLVYAGIRF